MRIKTPLIIAATAAALVIAPVATSSFTGADLVFAKGSRGIAVELALPEAAR